MFYQYYLFCFLKLDWRKFVKLTDEHEVIYDWLGKTEIHSNKHQHDFHSFFSQLSSLWRYFRKPVRIGSLIHTTINDKSLNRRSKWILLLEPGCYSSRKGILNISSFWMDWVQVQSQESKLYNSNFRAGWVGFKSNGVNFSKQFVIITACGTRVY